MRAPAPAPIYQNGLDRYEIDNCLPQMQAMKAGKIELQALSKGHYPGERMNSNILPGLTSLGYWNCREMQDWGLNPHRNEGLEIVFLETGGMGFEVDGRRHPLKAGNLTLTRPWQLHKLGDPNIGCGRLYWLILDVGVRRPNQEWQWPEWVVLAQKDLTELTRKLRHGEQAVWKANAPLKQAFRELAGCVVHWKRPHTHSRLTVALNRLLVEILDVLVEQQTEESPELVTRCRTVELFLKDLADNPASSAEPWTLEMMAAQCGMGITSMAKYCRQLVNIGPMAYLNLCRLEHASRELRLHPSKPITAVALAAGFNSSQYFATLFQRQYHQTPSAYQTMARRTPPTRPSAGFR